MGKTNFQCIKKSGKLPDCPEKRTAQKRYRIYTKGKKRATITLQPCLQGEKWEGKRFAYRTSKTCLWRRRKRLSRQNTVQTTSTMRAYQSTGFHTDATQCS